MAGSLGILSVQCKESLLISSQSHFRTQCLLYRHLVHLGNQTRVMNVRDYFSLSTVVFKK